MGQRVFALRFPKQVVILVRSGGACITTVTAVLPRRSWRTPKDPRYQLGNDRKADESELIPCGRRHGGGIVSLFKFLPSVPPPNPRPKQAVVEAREPTKREWRRALVEEQRRTESVRSGNFRF